MTDVACDDAANAAATHATPVSVKPTRYLKLKLRRYSRFKADLSPGSYDRIRARY